MQAVFGGCLSFYLLQSAALFSFQIAVKQVFFEQAFYFHSWLFSALLIEVLIKDLAEEPSSCCFTVSVILIYRVRQGFYLQLLFLILIGRK